MKIIRKMSSRAVVSMILILLLTSLYLIDYAISKAYDVEVVSITPSDNIVADGKSVVQIKVRLSFRNKYIQNHKLIAIPKGGGSFKNSKLLTDSNGEATFQYIPYLSSEFVKAKPIKLEIYDDDNSIFISVPARKTIVLDVVDSIGDANDDTNDGIF